MVQGGVDGTTYYDLVQVAPLNCQGGSPTPTATELDRKPQLHTRASNITRIN